MSSGNRGPARNFWGRRTHRGEKPGRAARLAPQFVPLGLKAADLSPEACRLRLDHAIAMAQLNPRGWRSPRLTVRANSAPKVGRRHLRSAAPPNRISTLAILARLAGKAGILDRIKQMVGA